MTGIKTEIGGSLETLIILWKSSSENKKLGISVVQIESTGEVTGGHKTRSL